MAIQIRYARNSDVIKVIGKPYPHSFRGLAAERDGEVLGVAGVMYSSPAQCFSTFSDEVKNDKRAIVRAIRMLRDILNTSGEVYAVPSPEEKTAHGFLKHVGFVPVTEDLYKWEVQQET